MTAQFVIHPEVRTTPGDEDGSVLINLENGMVFSLNGVGAKIWTKLEEGLAFEALLDSLAQDYTVPNQQLRSDLETFMRELEKKGLVESVASTRPTSGVKEVRNGVAT
jgi:hypothetical protein